MVGIILQAEKGGFFSDPINMILLSVAMFVLYFFMLRPGQKKAKEEKKLLENLNKGDKLVTAGGIHGKVFRVHEKTIDLEIAKNTIMTVEKSSISLELSKAYLEEKAE